ncbi:MAG: nuclear export factor [Aeromicrobium sp.]|nr:nuclear export factor [Aeromicrobium sp.]
MHHTTARLSAALLAVSLAAISGPASAHVGVSSTDAVQGGFGKATFRVPNESDSAATTKVVVTLPDSTPFAFVTAGAKPGWSVEVTKAELDEPTKVGDVELTEAVRTITWTAEDGGIPVGQFDEFALSGGPFPGSDEISFAAQQTYDDGEVVDWDDVQKGRTEPDHPAPVLALSPATDDAAATATSARHAADTGEESGSSDVATWLGGAALVVAMAAMVVAVRQNRRRA